VIARQWLEMVNGTCCRIDLGTGDVLPGNSRRAAGNIRAANPLAGLGPYGPLDAHNITSWNDPPRPRTAAPKPRKSPVPNVAW
jgi:hypothetical protein